jgi:dolichol kinase
MQDVEQYSFKSEVARKLFHLTNLSIPVIYFFLPKSTALAILIPITLFVVALDIIRFYHQPTANLFNKFFGLLLRSNERDSNHPRLNGATFVLISATICIIIFPKLFAVTGLITLTFADSAAALFGRRFGKRKIFDKSLEGSLAFFIAACFVILVTPKFNYEITEYLIGFTAAAIGALAEAVSGFLDNIAIPISVASILWIGYTLFLPHIDVHMIR